MGSTASLLFMFVPTTLRGTFAAQFIGLNAPPLDDLDVTYDFGLAEIVGSQLTGFKPSVLVSIGSPRIPRNDAWICAFSSNIVGLVGDRDKARTGSLAVSLLVDAARTWNLCITEVALGC